jgi:hypothetical protein
VDKRLRVNAHGVSDDTNVAAHEQIATACFVFIPLDAADDHFPDLGSLADLVNRKARHGPSLGQRLAYGHATSTRISHKILISKVSSGGSFGTGNR